MKHHDFGAKFHAIYDAAGARFTQGKRGADSFVTADEAAFLSANGIATQHLYDYVDDLTNYGEPSFEIALSVETVRRDYFFNVQGGVASQVVLDQQKLPAKSETVRGIGWLPRLLPKARAKLRGELPASLMYCCGGDRAFFQQHDIEPSEFLHLLWRHERDEPVIDWVVRRSSSK